MGPSIQQQRHNREVAKYGLAWAWILLIQKGQGPAKFHTTQLSLKNLNFE